MTRKTECTWPNCECPGQLPMCEDHEFQPQSTVESAPVKECAYCDATEMLTVIGPGRYACPEHRVKGLSDTKPVEASPSSGAGEVCACGHGHDEHCYSDGTLKPWCDTCPCKAYIPASASPQGAVPGPQALHFKQKIRKVITELNHICAETTYGGDMPKEIEGQLRKIRYFAKRAIKRLKPLKELATPEPHSPHVTSGYVQEVLPDDAEGPSCHVCGAIFTPTGLTRPEQPKYQCLSCGATTGCTPMKEVSKGIFTSRFCNCPNQADEDGSRCPICGKEKGAGCTPAEGPRKEYSIIKGQQKVSLELEQEHDGKTHAIPAAASVEERLTEIAERESKASEGPWKTNQFENQGERLFDLDAAGEKPLATLYWDNAVWLKEGEAEANAEFIKHARADIPYLLRLVAEICQERDEAHKSATLKIIAKLNTWVGRVGHEDYYKAQAKLLELEARAEQAERERDAVEKSHRKTE